MNDRLDKIDKLVSLLPNSEIVNENSAIIKEIKAKYKNLKDYTYKMDSKIRMGDVVRYVHLDMKKLSIFGIVVGIETENTYNKNVKTILLLNTVKHIVWRIATKKVYLFVSNGTHSSRARDVANRILMEHIDQYKALLAKEKSGIK